MKIKNYFLSLGATAMLLTACQTQEEEVETAEQKPEVEQDFSWKADEFADIQILRYQVPSFDKLTPQQKEYVYYLTQAGLSGRDIIYDQNYRHNLKIRRALENIVENYKGERSGADWENFMTYTKQVWFSNGIHHHYSMAKHQPAFSQEYFEGLLNDVSATLSADVLAAIFDPTVDAKKVNLDADLGLVKGSAVNFYGEGITAAEVAEFYKAKVNEDDSKRVLHGLNTKLVKNENGSITEKVWKIDGMYGSAIEEIVGWLEKAAAVAENEEQAEALKLLIEYYHTGDLKTWDEYNIKWVESTAGDIDYINGFIEVYNDPLGFKGSYENIVQIKDFEASERMQSVSENAQYFETNAPIMEAHKKEEVKGISYKVVNVAGESGDASPSTPIGVNLPNSDWIRAEHGSKSVSLGNIISAYEEASGGGILEEFANDDEEIERSKKYSGLAGKMHTALHEVIGHASGKLEPGVGTPSETIRSYASTLEEGRADLVALYYIVDSTLVDMGLMESLEVGKAEYDGYIRNGMMLQLRRLKLGEVIEESHMRNRAFVARWAFEKGEADSVIVKEVRDGNTYYDIKDYNKLRTIFGELLKEVQRIKSQGDYEAAKALIEGYGVQVDSEIHKEVLSRSEKLNIPPYSGFINPVYTVEKNDNDSIISIEITYPDDFEKQMLYYGKNYSFLPDEN